MPRIDVIGKSPHRIHIPTCREELEGAHTMWLGATRVSTAPGKAVSAKPPLRSSRRRVLGSSEPIALPLPR
jgi:hypothetical protein